MSLYIDIGYWQCPGCEHDNAYHNDSGKCIAKNCPCERTLRVTLIGSARLYE